MESFIKAFIRSSLLWFTAGIAIGVAMSANPGWLALRPAHAHANVAGFLTMFVFGVGYQLLPRLFGHPLHNRRMPTIHLYCANLGLAGLVAGFAIQPWAFAVGHWMVVGGGSVYAVGALLWVYNLWRTFDAADARQRARDARGSTVLPTIDS